MDLRNIHRTRYHSRGGEDGAESGVAEGSDVTGMLDRLEGLILCVLRSFPSHNQGQWLP